MKIKLGTGILSACVLFVFLGMLPAVSGAVTPTVTTLAVTAITTTTATAHGNISDLGSPDPNIHGFCWGTSENPTLFNNWTVDLGAAHHSGPFSAELGNLSPNTTYHIRAFASNLNSEEPEGRTADDGTSGLSYGNDITFITAAPNPAPPAVSTKAATNISSTSATGHGSITNLGSPAPTQFGICWNIAGNPTTSDHVATGGPATATGDFSFNLTGLSADTTYYFRAYAINANGTVYGSQYSFTTRAAAIPTLNEWGMILFIILASGIAMLNLRRKYE